MSTSLWRSVEQLADGAVLYEWRASLGNSNKAALSLLAPTNTLTESFPCRGRFPCGCRHRVIPDIRGGILAVCDCEHSGCPAITLEPKDVMVHALDRGKFGRAISVAAGFETVPYDDKVRRWIRIGRIRKPAANVYWSAPGDERGLLVAIEELSRNGGPFLLLTPTKRLHTDAVEALVARSASVIAAAEDWFRLNEAGTFDCSGAIDDLVAELARRIARQPVTAEVLQGIDTRIESIRGEHQELISTKERLLKMQSDGMFAFVTKIDAEAFRIMYAILACGDVAKAAVALDVKDSTLRSKIKLWKGKGSAYKVLEDVIRWRKQSGASSPVAFNDALLVNRGVSVDREGILSDVLDGLLSMTEGNWMELCDELAELIRPHVSRDSSRRS